MNRQRAGPGDAWIALHDGVAIAVNSFEEREAVIDGKGDIAVANNLTVGDLKTERSSSSSAGTSRVAGRGT